MTRKNQEEVASQRKSDAIRYLLPGQVNPERPTPRQDGILKIIAIPPDLQGNDNAEKQQQLQQLQKRIEKLLWMFMKLLALLRKITTSSLVLHLGRRRTLTLLQKTCRVMLMLLLLLMMKMMLMLNRYFNKKWS